MQKTRERILDTLAQQHSASAHELASAFGMTAANLRHHLAVLEDEGLVEVIAERPTGGRGRPEQVYALSQAAQPDNLAGLAGSLLAVLADARVAKRPETRLRHAAQRLAGDKAIERGAASARLVGATRRLNALGYRASWEARPGGPQIVLGHCPYAAIIGDHPELCQMDAELLAELLGQPVEQLAKLQPGPEGVPQCIFQFKT
jgi:predicted ArsR family transcriptional regulator